MVQLHEDEIEVDDELVRRLLATLSPAYDDLPLRRFDATGSDNALFRLGDDLLVRVPRQPGGTRTIEKEQRWLPYVGPHLPTAVPEIVAVGEPGFGYPEKWSLVRFLEGDRPVVPEVDDVPRRDLADDLAGVVQALRELAVPADAAADPALRSYRGRPLSSMDDSMQEYLRDCRELAQRVHVDLDLGAVEASWGQTMATPEASRTVEPRWYHGDINAENLLVSDGRLVALLDFGGLSVGDPTIDLALAWQLLDPAARSTFRSLVGVDDVTWRLARAWALVLGVMGLPYYWDTMPERCARGLFTARQALADLSV